jgi:hypothetical protein
MAADKATAKRLKLRSTELGKSNGKGRTVTVKLNAKARKSLRKVRSVKLQIAILATGADGRKGSATRALTAKK